MFSNVLFTHTDMDGAGSIILFKLAHDHLVLGKDYEIYISEVGDLDQRVQTAMISPLIHRDYTTIYFADLAPSTGVLINLINAGYNVMIFDHHITNVSLTRVLPSAVIVPENSMGVKECGTSLLFQYFNSLNPSDPRMNWFINGNQTLLSQLVENIRLYDTYEFKKAGDMKPKYLQTLFFMLGMEKFCKRYINRVKDPDSSLALLDPNDMDFVTAKMEVEQKAIDNFTPADVYPVDIRGYHCALILHSKGAGISELAYQFLNKYPEYDAMILLSLVGNGKFEIRTVRDDLNVAEELAKPIGGGGHPKASGAGWSDEDKERLVGLCLDILDPQNGMVTDESQGY